MTVAVTGASGHLGGTLVRALAARGVEVRAIDLIEGPALAGLDVEFHRADVRDGEAMRAALVGTDLVYHLAGKISVAGDPDGSVWDINVSGPSTVGRAALRAGVRRLVHTSSVHAFDLETAETLTEESARAVAAHLPVYDRSKAQGEEALRGVIAEGLDAVIVNPTGVIGPYDFGPSRMGQIFLGLRTRRLPFIVAGGFDWIDVRDVAEGIIAAGDRGRTGENYLMGGTRLAFEHVAQLAAKVNARSAPRLVVPLGIAKLWGPVGTLIARRTGSAWALTSETLHTLQFCPLVSSAKAQRELAFMTRPIEATVRDLYEWFERAGMV